MSVSQRQSACHLFALSRWILQGFNPIYENSFSLFFVGVCAVAKQNIWFCFALHFSAGSGEEKSHQPAARTWSVKDNVGNLMGTREGCPVTSWTIILCDRFTPTLHYFCRIRNSILLPTRKRQQQQATSRSMGSSRLGCHLNQLNEQLINHAHFAFIYLPRDKSIHQSINKRGPLGRPTFTSDSETLLSQHSVFGKKEALKCYMPHDWCGRASSWVLIPFRIGLNSEWIRGFTSNECKSASYAAKIDGFGEGLECRITKSLWLGCGLLNGIPVQTAILKAIFKEKTSN